MRMSKRTFEQKIHKRVVSSMSRKTSRIVAVSLLASSIIVMGLGGLDSDQSLSAQENGSSSFAETVSKLEEKVSDLESENSRLQDEVTRLSEGFSNNLAGSDFEDENLTASESDGEDELDEEENESEATETVEGTEEKVREYTITVKDGEPSSVVAEQLETLGLIEDRYAFNDFLENYGYAKRVRPGNYVVTADMNTTEMALALMR